MNNRPFDTTYSRDMRAPVPPPFDAYGHQAGLRESLLYAGFWRRFVASVIDGVLLAIVLLAIVNAILVRILENTVDRATTGSDPVRDLATWFVINLALYVVIYWLYFAGMESSARQATFGKRMLGIVVTDLERNRISFGRASARFFARYLSAITLLIGYLIQPFTAKRQALHDIIAGTLVVRT